MINPSPGGIYTIFPGFMFATLPNEMPALNSSSQQKYNFPKI